MNPSTSADDSLPGAFGTSSHVLRGEDSTVNSTVGNVEESSLSFLSAVELQVFKTFVKNFLAIRDLRYDDATALEYVFGPTIKQVFEMIQEEQVVIYQNPSSKRIIVKVDGQSEPFDYWIAPGHCICQCMSFIHGNKPYCKHILAAHLFLALTPDQKYSPISNEDFHAAMSHLTEP